MGSVLRRLHLGSLLLLASLVLGSFTLAVYLGLDPGEAMEGRVPESDLEADPRAHGAIM
jgi:hypothetical protein